MFRLIKKYKIAILAVLIDLFLLWLLCYSDFVLPFINPSLYQYQHSGTSFPRNFNQVILWSVLHAPTSIVLGLIFGWMPNSGAISILCTIQTGVIAYYLEKYTKYKKHLKIKA